MPKKSGLPKGVTEFQDRHKNWHLRYRAKGRETYYFKSRPGQPEWREEYERCLSGEAAPKITRTSERTKPGSISALISVYYGMPEFTGLAASSKVTYRNILERFRDAHGSKMVATLTRAHIKAIIGAMSETPSAANNLLDRIKILMKVAMDEGWRNDDPTYRVTGFKVSNDGFHTWSEDEIAQFIAKHPRGSKAHLAMSLLLYTGQRRSDMVTMGWQNIDGNRIRVKQIKTGAMLSIPMHRELASLIASMPKENMTFLLTDFGKPFGVAGFGNKMRDWCNQAELKHCSAHGLRKAAARRLAEAGCSNSEIKAITGHKTDKEVNRYTAAASQITLSDRAIEAIGGSDGEQENGYSEKGLAKTAPQVPEISTPKGRSGGGD